MTIIEIIKNSEIFKYSGDKITDTIAKESKIKKFQNGKMLFLDGDSGTDLYILASGKIKIYKSAPDGREIIMKLIQPGESFAEILLFENNKYPASAVAIEDSTALAINKNTVLKALDDEESRNEFISGLMKKMRYLTQRIIFLTAFDVEERFFKFLLNNYGKKKSYSIQISKKDLASTIGTIPETFSRLIKRLKQRNVITWEKDIITLQKDFWENNFYDD